MWWLNTEREKIVPPRSTIMDSVNGRLQSYTVPYTTAYMPNTLRIRPYFAIKHVIVLRSYMPVYMPNTLRIRPYFAIKHVIVLRSYMPVTVYDEIRRNTEVVNGAFIVINDRIFSVYSHKRSYFYQIR